MGLQRLLVKMLKTLKISTKRKQEIIDITKQVESVIKQEKIKQGIALIYVPHATAAVIINENADPNICEDIINALNKIIKEHDGWLHDRIDNNAAAHIKASILGPSESVIIANNKIVLGTWQNIALIELDGPRQREILIEIISD